MSRVAFIAGAAGGIGRAIGARLLADGCVRVNGTVPKASHRPKTGERVEIVWPKPVPAGVVPQDIPLQVIDEDDDLLVINKSPDLVVHPAHGHADGTLVNALLHHCRGSLSGIGGVERGGSPGDGFSHLLHEGGDVGLFGHRYLHGSLVPGNMSIAVLL